MKYALIVAAFASQTAIAVDNHLTICTYGDKERKIEIAYPQNTTLPCEVQYTKDGEMKVLWNAKGEVGFCEEKAASFVEKHRSWGWQCASPADLSPEDETDNNNTDPDNEQNETIISR